jgi:hypothetical protein
MTLSSAIALVYSLFSRLSTDLLLRAISYSRANSDVRDEGGVDEMMMEYMTALMQQAKRLDERSQSQPMSHPSLKLSGGEGLPRLIMPLVIDEVFETDSRAPGGNRTSTAAESMLLHPIGDNQISTIALRTHDQVMRSGLDIQGKGGSQVDSRVQRDKPPCPGSWTRSWVIVRSTRSEEAHRSSRCSATDGDGTTRLQSTSSRSYAALAVWLDRATTQFRFFGPSSFNTALQLVLRPHFLVRFV